MSSVGEVILNKINNIMKYTKNDIEYFYLNDLFQIKEYVKGFNNNKKRFLTAKFKDEDVIFGRLVMNNNIIVDKTYSPKYSKYFVKCDSVLSQFSEYIKNDKNMSIKEAPAIISNNICFFKDKNGIEHDVEMRGERTKDGIYFKCKDLQNVFEMNSLVYDINHKDSAFTYNTDFLYFSNLDFSRTIQTKEEQTFLTFSGLMKVVRNSRTGRAKEFADWLDEIVFSSIAGSEDSRLNVATKVLGGVERLNDVISKHARKISCIYILKTNIKVDNDIIYKFGFSDDLNRRFKEHSKVLGDVELESFILISNIFKSKAENHFKDSMSCFNKMYNKPGFESMTELLFLNSESKKILRECLSNISSLYCEDNQKLISDLNLQLVEIKTKYEADIQILKHRLELKDKDIELKDKEIKILEREAILKDKLLQFYEEKK